MIWKKFPPRVYLYGLGAIVVLVAAFYLTVGLEAKNSVNNQLLNKEKVVARAESNNISSFFEAFGNSITVLSNLSSIKAKNTTTQRDLDIFVSQKAVGIIGGVILTDEEGTVIFNSNVKGTHDTGASIADRDYFAWAKVQKEDDQHFVSDPVISRLGGSQGQTIVTVASPVLSSGEFVGLIGSSVELRSLTERYLEVLKVSEATDVYLIDHNGIMLYNNFDPGTIGSNIVGISQNFKEMVGKTSEGTSEFSYRDHMHKDPVVHDIVYTPVKAGNQSWVLIISTPANSTELWGLTTPLYIRLLVFFVLLTVTLFLFGVITIEEVQNKQMAPKPGEKSQNK